MTTSDADAYNELENNASGTATSSDPTNTKPRSSLIWLIPLIIVAGIATFAIPKVLTQIYFMEEESKARKGPNVIGSRTDVLPPPGVSTDPYANLRVGGGNGEETNQSGAATSADK